MAGLLELGYILDRVFESRSSKFERASWVMGRLNDALLTSRENLLSWWQMRTILDSGLIKSGLWRKRKGNGDWDFGLELPT